MFDDEIYRKLSEDEQHKELYAYFGLCIYYFQVLEHKLINMILIIGKSRKIDMTPKEYDELFYSFSDKTMGNLIQKIKEEYKLSKEDKKLLDFILKKRNYTAHHFFKDKISDTFNLDGRIKLINELNDLIEKTQEIDSHLNTYIDDYLNKFGITKNILELELEKFRKGDVEIDLKFEK